MSKTILIRPQSPSESGRASIYYIDGNEEKIETGPPDKAMELKDYVLAQIDALVAKGHTNFVVDLKLVRWVSSSDVGMMLSWYRLATKRKARLVLANLSESVREVMKITKLDTVMKVFDGIEEAREYVEDVKS